jgi:ribonuclease R
MPRRTKPTQKDPFASREARRYADPIASRELILATLRDARGPLKLDKLLDALGLHTASQRTALDKRLNAMLRAGQLLQNRRGGYLPVDEREMLRGTITGHRDGYGFLLPDTGEDDVYLAPREMRAVLHGDRVLVRVTGVDRRGRPEGRIIEVLQRAHETVVGRLHRESGLTYVIAEDRRIHQDILIPRERLRGARHHQIVVARLLEQPSQHNQPIGAIEEILGERSKPGMEVEIALRSHGIPADWPQPVMAQTKRLPKQLSAAAKQNREDLRDRAFVTIDGEDAKDFDDAVWCERRGLDWLLCVAIADVAHYVTLDSALDESARDRGTSVYFPGRVIPMLPEVLSNGLCSLNPEVDRLALVCEMRIRAGRLQRSQFKEAVIRSHARLTYTQVNEWLFETGKHRQQAPDALRQPLQNLAGVFAELLTARQQRGALDFESDEVRFEFDRRGRIAAILPYQRNDAHRLIEECMVTANVCAARFLTRHKLAGLYRNHAGPDGDKLLNLQLFLREFGLRLSGGDNPGPEDYADLIERTRTRDDAFLIHTVLLRSLSQAVYQPRCKGHFGLALDRYAHFTSPIRRYPDLVVHRAIKQNLQKAGTLKAGAAALEELGTHCSFTERRAEEATRDAANHLKCEFMQAHVGELFEGVISGVTSFGVFVELLELRTEGLVHVTALPRDYYHFDPVRHTLEGERGRHAFRLGDRLNVVVAAVHLDEAKVEFTLPEQGRQREQRRSTRTLRRRTKR